MSEGDAIRSLLSRAFGDPGASNGIMDLGKIRIKSNVRRELEGMVGSSLAAYTGWLISQGRLDPETAQADLNRFCEEADL